MLKEFPQDVTDLGGRVVDSLGGVAQGGSLDNEQDVPKGTVET